MSITDNNLLMPITSVEKTISDSFTLETSVFMDLPLLTSENNTQYSILMEKMSEIPLLLVFLKKLKPQSQHTKTKDMASKTETQLLSEKSRV